MNSETPKKPEASKSVGPKAGGLPDFSGLAAATRSPAATGGLPDFSIFTGEQKKVSEVVPVVAAPPAKIELDVKTSPKVVIASETKEKLSPLANPKSVVIKPATAPVLAVAPAKVVEKTVNADAVQKKPSSASDSLAGFREFAAIAGSVAAPVVSVDSGTTRSSASLKTTVTPESASRATESITTPAASTTVTKVKRAKETNIFGYTWIPYASDSMAFAMFAASIHQMYDAFANGIALNLAIPQVMSLAATGVVMLAISLALRLLSKIADQSST